MSDRKEGPLFEMRDAMERELEVNNVVTEVLNAANAAIWRGPLSAAEARLAWALVVEQMATSMALDRRTDVYRDWMTR